MARIIDASLSAGDGAGCDPRALHGEWGRLDAASRRGLAYTPQVKAETDALYERVKHVVPAVEWPAYAPLIAAINRIKREKNAVILAHNYMTPEIFHCVGDFQGDSLQLAREAAMKRTPRSSCKPASTSWPRRRRFSRPRRRC